MVCFRSIGAHDLNLRCGRKKSPMLVVITHTHTPHNRIFGAVSSFVCAELIETFHQESFAGCTISVELVIVMPSFTYAIKCLIPTPRKNLFRIVYSRSGEPASKLALQRIRIHSNVVIFQFWNGKVCIVLDGSGRLARNAGAPSNHVAQIQNVLQWLSHTIIRHFDKYHLRANAIMRRLGCSPNMHALFAHAHTFRMCASSARCAPISLRSRYAMCLTRSATAAWPLMACCLHRSRAIVIVPMLARSIANERMHTHSSLSLSLYPTLFI